MAELHVTRWGSGPPALFVHGSFGYGEETWSAQRPLADDFELLLVDRRGFGRSPADGRVDFDRDADDIARLLPRGSHLVGHSYGGVVALLAASRDPSAVRSLTVIEPPALALVRASCPPADEFIDELERLAARTRDPATYRTGFFRAFGFRPKHVELDGPMLVAARASMTERGPWEADIPLDALASAPFPKLVVRGDWRTAPAEAQRRAGTVFSAVCDVLEARLDAEGAVFPATHSPQLLGRPFNDRLRAFWSAC